MITQNGVLGKNNLESMKNRLLIVDDDPDILESLKEVVALELPEYSIDLADNYEKAVSATADFYPNVALLDIKLGSKSGVDLIPKLKEINPDIICIMMTAHRDNAYTIKALRFGASDYLNKPIDPHTLVQTIKRLYQEKLLKREMEKTERRFKVVFEQAAQWLFLVDSKGKLIRANETALAFLGKTNEMVKGMVLWNTPWWRTSPNAQFRIQTGFAKVVNGEFYCDEIEVNRNGIINVYELTMKAVLYNEDEENPIVIECRNITARKKAEKEIERLNTTLEQRVIERNAELEKLVKLLEQEIEQRKTIELSLRLAQQQSENSSQAKSQFISKMNHELRTPMNAILGFAQLLCIEEELDPVHAEYAKNIVEAGYHLLDIINDILDLSHIVSKKTKPLSIRLSLNELLNSCLASQEKLISSRNVRIRNEIGGKSDWFVLADEKSLKQVINNLLNNAIKFNKDGGEVILRCVSLENQRLRIKITDTGKGIKKEFHDLVFQPFERADSDVNVAGIGVGLTLSKYLIESMDGELSFESEAGKGSTFWVDIKCCEE